MSSHQFLFVRDHEDFFNWSACIVALNLTKEALCEYMEEVADRYVRGLPDINHVAIFIEHNRSNDGKAYVMEKLKCGCIPCKSLYKRIQDDLLGSPESSILLESTENAGKSKPWWILLKMNLRHAGKNTQQIQDCDLKLLCKVLQLCRLFEPAKNIEKVIANRNALVHSSSNELSTETKRSYLSFLEDFLESPGLNGRPTVQKAKTEITCMKSNNSRFQVPKKECDELKQSIEAQMKAIENDIEEFNRKNLNVATLEEIMKIIKNNKVTVEQRKRLQERKEAKLHEVAEIGRQEGEQVFNGRGGCVGKYVGGVSGAAGAWVAGKFRQYTQ